MKEGYLRVSELTTLLGLTSVPSKENESTRLIALGEQGDVYRCVGFGDVRDHSLTSSVYSLLSKPKMMDIRCPS